MATFHVFNLRYAISTAVLVTLGQIFCCAEANRGLHTYRPNSWARLILRGGETRAAPPLSSTSTTVPTFKPLPSSTYRSSSTTSKSAKLKKKRKKKSSSTTAYPPSSSISRPPASTATDVKPTLTPPISSTSSTPKEGAATKTSAGSLDVSDTDSEDVSTAPLSPKNELPKPSSARVSSKNKNEFESLHNKMPSLFTRDEEKQYDTYAACLAATESLRRLRDSVLKKKKSSAVASEDKSWKSIIQDNLGGNSSTEKGIVAGKESDPALSEEYKRACAEYVLNSSKAIKALGLSVTQFNQLGREISRNRDLKEKVMEQAYLYRMASTIKMDKIPLIQDPDSKQLLKSTRRRRVQMFVRSITEIEELREEQTQKLRQSLNIDKLPSNVNLCDPNVLPLLSPQVRSVIEAFPLEAEKIVKKYGLNSDEFNQMLEETRGNPVFRWRVNKFRKEVGKKGCGSEEMEDSKMSLGDN
mmetsp:Transcript_3009/g.5623  ORF Transcript_3009/g.5623 Transcript_3009/m.5623 type:complete len:470 (+) Transcript_3009:98-1507(+)